MNHPVKFKHIMVLTGEPSGDLHAGHLIKEIKKSEPNIYFSGIGGQHLEHQGVDLFYNIANLSAMGLTEVIMQFRQIKQAFDLFKKKLKSNTPDLLILVDYPGFNLKAAKFVKKHYKIKVLYYIAPKVWAWNKSRLKKIKKYVDHAALTLPFEERIYKKAKIQATYVGNPLLDDYPENISKPFLRRYGLSRKKHLVIGLMPGSRKTEIDNLLGIMIKAADKISTHLICQENQKVSFLISKANSIKHEHIEAVLKNSGVKHLFQIEKVPAKDIFVKSDLVVAASGTVTLEAALCCIPTIIIYKMSRITHHIAKRVVKIQYAGLANLIVNKEIMPELLQDDATAEKISNKAIYMLDNLIYFENQLQMVRKMLGKGGASSKTATIAMGML
ncbi:MAG: lipid-A-disaccharide synthase [Deltaproteobacteria bacterium]|jgi:lipid-A-disaccharide synthase|nr:lipid-A-disaccharide synthase [Deltaproteobacteria bacterium]